MQSRSDVAVFHSHIAFERSRIEAAAIYCSDGRFADHFDDFLHNGLRLARYDRVALPGGPACLADHPQGHVDAQSAVDELHFLVKAHELKRVVLIAHEGCAFYVKRLGLAERRMELLQQADLARAAAFIRQVTGADHVEGYFARVVHGVIAFEPVEV